MGDLPLQLLLTSMLLMMLTCAVKSEGNCGISWYYDENREVCLDKCGANNADRCTVNEICSSSVSWGANFQPPQCLSLCSEPCDDNGYCHPLSHKCLPCSSICSGTDLRLCRIHCYDFTFVSNTRFHYASQQRTKLPVPNTISDFNSDRSSTGNVTKHICAINQQYDGDRNTCLDRCGVDNETVCDVSQFCSSTVDWAPSFAMPQCLSHCIKHCRASEYCDHETSRCRSCDQLCSGQETDNCRKYCFEIFVTRTTSAIPPFGTRSLIQNCTSDQYYDSDRNVCWERCGVNNEIKCSIGFICNSKSQSESPQSCVSWCDPPCDAMSYCNYTSRKCLSCGPICKSSDMNACRINCYDQYVIVISKTPSSKQPDKCHTNQYFDENKRVCRDRCGLDKKLTCRVDEFCSSTLASTAHIDPSVCINLCDVSCRDDYYCDPLTRTCRICTTDCAGPDRDRCPIYCDEYAPLSTAIPRSGASATDSCPTCISVCVAAIALSATLIVIGLTTAVIVCVYKRLHRGNRNNTPGREQTEQPEEETHLNESNVITANDIRETNVT